MFVVKRDESNPIISPNPDLSWQNMATFNGCPVKIGNKTYCLYRAISSEDTFFQPGLNISIIGIAESSDGQNFTNHRKLIEPVEAWEKYSCEDPRVVFLEGKYYIFYTAISNYPITPDGIKIAVAISDDLKTISERRLVTPFNAKAMSLFPEKINGKYVILHRIWPNISIDYVDDLDFSSEEKWLEEKDKIPPRHGMWDNAKIGAGAPPIKTDKGWLLIYQSVGKESGQYKIGAMLLDLNDPSKVLYRSRHPLLEPEEWYETTGIKPGIAYPCGAVVMEGNLIVYYGAADNVICAATIKLDTLLDELMNQHEENSVLHSVSFKR